MPWWLLARFGWFPRNTPTLFELDDVILSDVPFCGLHAEDLADRPNAPSAGGLDQVVVTVKARVLGRVGDNLEDPFGAGLDLPAGARDTRHVLRGLHDHLLVQVTGWHLVDILVVGGTRFLGRAVVDAALGRGHAVTLFNRGLTDPDLFPGLETIRGDRRKDASKLSGRRFDVVVDVAGMDPADVRPVVEAVSSFAGRYVFVSTVSVYADHSIPQVEGQPLLAAAESQGPGEAYGAGKAAAEDVVIGTFGDRALVVRPGLIVGPHDPTDRFAYWPRRIARGGRVLAPGGPDHPAQFIDVQDLASWIVVAAEDRLGGAFNATGHPTTLGAVLEACQRVVAARSEIVWAKDEDLLAAGVSPWMGVPMWIRVPGWEAHAEVSIERALSAGLVFRPLDETVRDTLAWDLARGGPSRGAEGLAHEREQELLGQLAPPNI